MSDDIVTQLSARLDELTKRVDRIVAETSAPRPWWKWKPRTPMEVVALIGIPATFVVALYTFHEEVWMKVQRLDAATTMAAQARLEELQDLRQEIFVLQSRGQDSEIAALMEARQARRDRLVQDSFLYFQQQPAYFTKKEKILLAEELQLAQRQGDALQVVADVEGAGSIEKSDMARFKGSLLGANGPAQDLEAARTQFRVAMSHAEDYESESGRKQLWAKVSFHWLFTEMAYGGDCALAAPSARLLSGLLAEDPAYLATLDKSARELLVVFEDRCGPVPADR